jgi:glycosyltransferase involved in cell wall biosynthesis
MNKEIVVSVQCLVYNHAPYLRQCLDGIVMQRTDFYFEAIVHDDASTDGSTEIINDYANRYPDIIKPIVEKENQYSKGKESKAQSLINSRLIGKYIAFCEGDDYWTDPCKLQKQVNYLESHPSCGMCYSSFDMVEENTGKFTPDLFRNRPEDSPMYFPTPESFIVQLAYVAPPSWLVRSELYFSVPSSDQIKRIDETFVQFTHYLARSEVFVFKEPMVTYRVLEESASHTKDFGKKYSYRRSLLDTQCALVRYYNLDKGILSICRKSYYKWLIKQAMDRCDLSVIKKVSKGDTNKDIIESLIIHDFSGLCLIRKCYKVSRKIPLVRGWVSHFFNGGL